MQGQVVGWWDKLKKKNRSLCGCGDENCFNFEYRL